jgi:hypothetical protein
VLSVCVSLHVCVSVASVYVVRFSCGDVHRLSS